MTQWASIILPADQLRKWIGSAKEALKYLLRITSKSVASLHIAVSEKSLLELLLIMFIIEGTLHGYNEQSINTIAKHFVGLRNQAEVMISCIVIILT